MQDVGGLMGRMVRAFHTGDVADVDSFVGEAYVDHQGLRDVEVLGPAGFRRVVEAARGAFGDLHVSVDDLIVDGDRAAARLRWTGRRASDGKAIEHWGTRLWVIPDAG